MVMFMKNQIDKIKRILKLREHDGLHYHYITQRIALTDEMLRDKSMILFYLVLSKQEHNDFIDKIIKEIENV